MVRGYTATYWINPRITVTLHTHWQRILPRILSTRLQRKTKSSEIFAINVKRSYSLYILYGVRPPAHCAGDLNLLCRMDFEMYFAHDWSITWMSRRDPFVMCDSTHANDANSFNSLIHIWPFPADFGRCTITCPRNVSRIFALLLVLMNLLGHHLVFHQLNFPGGEPTSLPIALYQLLIWSINHISDPTCDVTIEVATPQVGPWTNQ